MYAANGESARDRKRCTPDYVCTSLLPVISNFLIVLAIFCNLVFITLLAQTRIFAIPFLHKLRGLLRIHCFRKKGNPLDIVQ